MIDMNPRFFLPLVTAASLCFAGQLQAKPQDVIGDDDASRYVNSGWNSDKGDGTGFGPWELRATTAKEQNSHAGFYIASADAKPDLQNAAIRGKAFGMYANGVSFEAAAAFRAFDKPLLPGQSFSWIMENGEIVKKFDVDTDTDGGSLGLTLRTGNANSDAGEYNVGVRFEIGYYKKANAYILYDADGMKKLDVPFTDAGLAITFTLVTPDTYNLEITSLADKKTVKLNGRKLGGTLGDPIASFCLFDRNGESNDVYFNGFQILQAPE